jgi:hypothetical protein
LILDNMKKRKTIDSFFKPIGSTANCIQSFRSRGCQGNVEGDARAPNVEGDDHVKNSINQNFHAIKPMEEEGADLEHEQIVATRFERDPGKRAQILELPPDQQTKLEDFIFQRAHINQYCQSTHSVN